MTSQPRHRFRDEWLLALLSDAPEIAGERVAAWRAAGAPFLSQCVVDAGALPFDEIGRRVEARYRIRFLPPAPTGVELGRDVLRQLPEGVCRRYGVLPLRPTESGLEVLTADPLDAEALQALEWTAGGGVTPVYGLPAWVEREVARAFSGETVIYDLIERLDVHGHLEVIEEGGDPGDPAPDGEIHAPVIRLVDALLVDAVTRGASDVHIGHEEQSTEVRYRIDGLLRKVQVLPRYVGAGPVVSRLKIMAELDLAERRRPQDGRARVRVDGRDVSLRVSTLPTRAGEKVVVRILDDESARMPLEELGFQAPVRRRLEGLLEHRSGMILVTGPTGSGKTTTLYSMVQRLGRESINVVSVEDPVEYRLGGVTQVQVSERRGLTFASVLRSVLRQDPDVILVGEIRDPETAEVAIQAALTGHLVLTTVHANDATAAVTRLADLGVASFKLAGSLLATTAQRLVRRVCPACSVEMESAEVPQALAEALRARGFPCRLRTARGCPKCDEMGYRGRLPLVELFQLDEPLRTAIQGGASGSALRRHAREAGALLTLSDDALWHLGTGATTFDEVEPHLDLGADPSPPEKGRSEGLRPALPERAPLAVVVAEGGASVDEVLPDAVASALARCGLRAVGTASEGAALADIVRADPDLVVLSGRLEPWVGVDLAVGVRRWLGLRDLPILALASHEGGAARLREAGVDEVLTLPLTADPASRIRSLLVRRTGWSTPEAIARPRIPADEAARLADLRSLDILDTPPEPRFDRFTRAAAEFFQVPVSLVNLIDDDRQWSKSAVGIEPGETPRDLSFCGHAILDDALLVVEDALLDPRFAENPAVHGDPPVRFYAGRPIHGPGGHRIGSFCVIDHRPRTVTEAERAWLDAQCRLLEEELRRELVPVSPGVDGLGAATPS